MKKTGKRQEEHKKNWGSVLGALLKGCVIGLTAAMLTLLVCAFAVAEGWLGQSVMTHAVSAACVLGGIIGSAVAIHQNRDLALPLGLGTGGMLFALLLVLGLFLGGDAPTGDEIPTVLLSCLCGGAVAGILGRKTKKKRKR